MFKMQQSATYKWPVKISIPVDGGKYETQEFEANFKRLKRDEIVALKESDIDDTEAVKMVLLGWSGIVGEDGAEVPFSDENLVKLLNVTGVTTAIANSFFDSVTGAAKAKN